MLKKTDQARAKWEAGDYVGCLKILKTFRIGISRDQHLVFANGYETMVHPGFYLQTRGEDWVNQAQAAGRVAADAYFQRSAK